MPSALDGIRVVEFSHLIQGPQCGQMLHDLGAAVIKVESPLLGDLGRLIPVNAADPRPPYFHAHNRGKRSIALDLRTAGGLEVVRRLIKRADVVIANIRPGGMDRLALSYEDCAALNPRLVYAVASTFGPRGVRADRPGVDLLGQAFGGLASRTGTPDRPVMAGATIADSAGAQVLCVGILAALMARERTGRGQRVDSSLYGSQIWAQAGEISYQLIGGQDFPRVEGGQPNLSRASVYGIWPTADGAIGITGVPEANWVDFCVALDDAALAADPRFLDQPSRAEHVDELRAAVGSIFRGRTTAEWEQRLDAADIRNAPAQSYEEIEHDPQARENGYLNAVDHPDWGEMVSIGSPLSLSDTPTAPAIRAPALGEHTDEVLAELGYAAEAVDAFRASGVTAPHAPEG